MFQQALESKAAFLIDVKADKRFGTPVEPFQSRQILELPRVTGKWIIALALLMR